MTMVMATATATATGAIELLQACRKNAVNPALTAFFYSGIAHLGYAHPFIINLPAAQDSVLTARLERAREQLAAA
jgi:hypothetical protein